MLLLFKEHQHRIFIQYLCIFLIRREENSKNAGDGSKNTPYRIEFNIETEKMCTNVRTATKKTLFCVCFFVFLYFTRTFERFFSVTGCDMEEMFEVCVPGSSCEMILELLMSENISFSA